MAVRLTTIRGGFQARKLEIILKEINEKFIEYGILKDRLTHDKWTKLMSTILQGEYSMVSPVRQDFHEHMIKDRKDKLHTYRLNIQKLDEILDTYIPPPDLETQDTGIKAPSPIPLSSRSVTPSTARTSTPDVEKKGKGKQPATKESRAEKRTELKAMVSIESVTRPRATPQSRVSTKIVTQRNTPDPDLGPNWEETFRDEINFLRKGETILKKTIEEQQFKIKELEQTVEKLEKRNISLKDDIESLAGDITGEKDDKLDVVNKAEKEITVLRKELQLKDRSLEKSLIERNQLLERLASATDSSITSSTRLITDMSDLHNPKKVADKYTELFDNEWADAFQVLTLENRVEDKAAIGLLFEILQDCYMFCERTNRSHTNLLLEDLMYPFKRDKDIKESDLAKLDDDTLKLIKDAKKLAGQHAVAQIQVQFSKQMAATKKNVYNEKYIKKLYPYMDKCLELCWFMVLQSPPLHIDDDRNSRYGEEFDKDLFNFYKTTGSKIDYIIWPTLYLSYKGIVLAKGIAQPKQEAVALRISSRQSLK